MERDPSCELMVFWRVTGTKLEPAEDVDARECVWSMETAMSWFGAVRATVNVSFSRPK